jgi:hypothetical protein
MGLPRIFSAAAQSALALESRDPPGENTAYMVMGFSGYLAIAGEATTANKASTARRQKGLQYLFISYLLSLFE